MLALFCPFSGAQVPLSWSDARDVDTHSMQKRAGMRVFRQQAPCLLHRGRENEKPNWTWKPVCFLAEKSQKSRQRSNNDQYQAGSHSQRWGIQNPDVPRLWWSVNTAHTHTTLTYVRTQTSRGAILYRQGATSCDLPCAGAADEAPGFTDVCHGEGAVLEEKSQEDTSVRHNSSSLHFFRCNDQCQ